MVLSVTMKAVFGAVDLQSCILQLVPQFMPGLDCSGGQYVGILVTASKPMSSTHPFRVKSLYLAGKGVRMAAKRFLPAVVLVDTRLQRNQGLSSPAAKMVLGLV